MQEEEELGRITPTLLRRAETMCPRLLHHEYFSGRVLSSLGDSPFEVGARLTEDARTWHQGNVRAEHGFPEPTDLEPEQRAVYRVAADEYVRRFGGEDVEIHDLGWVTEFTELGVRLSGQVGIAAVATDDRHEVRVLRLATRDLLDDVDMKFTILRTADWAKSTLHVVAVDLLKGESAEYDVDVDAHLSDAREWLSERVDIIRARSNWQGPVAGSGCRNCKCVPGCKALTRSA
ncbi:MAG TPA: hypothetical protein VL856_12490 [Acidimicrobiia bacterium]|jgi:hypothetical protein|nr:hypothetical protein [Acidimicrobiia bacterium]